MKTKVTKEEFEMLFANCGYTMVDFYEGEDFYDIDVEEYHIKMEDIELLEI